MESSNKVRLLIVDDQTMLREVLAALLSQEECFEVVGQAGDGPQAIEMNKLLRPDIVLLDVMLPGLNGAEVHVRMAEENPAPKVLVISGQENPAVIQRMIKLGVNGIVHKSSALNCLKEAINQVMDGHTYYCPTIAKMVRTILLDPSAGQDLLSTREKEILQLLAEANSAKEIAARLSISVKTVENHRQNIMHKLGIHDVVGLTRYAIKVGLVSV